jgi:hypothetical protein
LKFQQFDGTENVEGYFRVFELTCSALNSGAGVSEQDMRTILLNKLAGGAKSWLLGLGASVDVLGYADLKSQLIAHF